MGETGERPDPDALLLRVKAEEQKSGRAKLKIFFGYAPGVGKTFKMLELARELVIQKVDVVVGYVETHARYDTAALMLGMEILPRRTLLYRGVQLEEFDLEGALKRKPAILILDELAHTNAPGGRHTKRWQDVLDLLDAGIEVHTTLNIQHVESLNDIVAQITTVRVRETVPDALLDRADEIELVDLPPEALLVRLAEGKVYLPEQAARAAQHFFQRGNLLALRELALRRAAERVDAEVLAYRKAHEIASTWPTAERILVCVGPSPASARLVRAASRMAGTLRGPWIAASVEAAGLGPLSTTDQERVEAHLRLARSLGGEVARLTGARAGQAVLEYARKHNVTRIVIGKPARSRLVGLLRRTLFDEVVRESGDIDLYVISGDEGPPPEARKPREPPEVDWPAYGWTVALVALATVGATIVHPVLAPPDLVMLYLLVIMVVAARFGRGPSVLASALSVLVYDFFFVPPFWTFAVHDQRHVLTFLMMFIVGLLISALTLRIRRQEHEARGREERTATLYALARDLGSALDREQVALVTAQHAVDVLGGGAAVLFPDAHRQLVLGAKGGVDLALEAQELSVATWAFEHGRPAGRGTDTLPGARVTCVPLTSGPEPLGVLALAGAEHDPLAGDSRHFLEAFVRQAALALERARLAEEAKAAALRARTEEMRSSLLSAVSHDLRTPLAAITGAATSLRDGSTVIPDGQRAELLATICEEAERLERLVGNLLDMTRLESGSVEVKREWVPLEEIVGAALVRLESALQERPITIDLPADLPLVSVDPVLLEQVFVNLLENAAKYTPAGSTIEIRARMQPGRVAMEVADRGPGLPRGSQSRVFEKFYRGTRGGSGVGLGLSICRGIIEAHGGSLAAENRPDGGAVFRFSIPLVAGPPSISDEAEPRPPERNVS